MVRRPPRPSHHRRARLAATPSAEPPTVGGAPCRRRSARGSTDRPGAAAAGGRAAPDLPTTAGRAARRRAAWLRVRPSTPTGEPENRHGSEIFAHSTDHSGRSWEPESVGDPRLAAHGPHPARHPAPRPPNFHRKSDAGQDAGPPGGSKAPRPAPGSRRAPSTRRSRPRADRPPARRRRAHPVTTKPGARNRTEHEPTAGRDGPGRGADTRTRRPHRITALHNASHLDPPVQPRRDREGEQLDRTRTTTGKGRDWAIICPIQNTVDSPAQSRTGRDPAPMSAILRKIRNESIHSGPR